MCQAPRRDDSRLIIHFDYDCFYAAVFEHEDPRLKSLPLAVQQKQIIVTCNYEARRRGLYKLQLVREAKAKCPEVIIVLGEDLTRFRNASKANYNFLRQFTWSHKVERLGFDEVFLDVTDLVLHNIPLINKHDPCQSFFQLSRTDPTQGFEYDASRFSGFTHPVLPDSKGERILSPDDPEDLSLRLRLASQLARFLRHELEEKQGYTSTVGISTNKLVSKLIGNVHKPKGQTTLLPPYSANIHHESNVMDFIDTHDIGKIPGVGFKIAQRLRSLVLQRPAEFDAGLVYGGTKENVSVADVRARPDITPETLSQVLNGPGMSTSLPGRVWGLLHGVDNTEVAKAKEVPLQISIEDSYIRLDEMEEVIKELEHLSTSLIKRLRLDLTATLESENKDPDDAAEKGDERIWLAFPSTLRLSTRPRPPLNADGTRPRTFTRISKSTPMPRFIFSLQAEIGRLSERLVSESLIPLFRQLHREKSGWNLSLVNLCATNMTMAAGIGKNEIGQDIGRMFRHQKDRLRDWKVEDVDIPPDANVMPSDKDLSQQNRDSMNIKVHELSRGDHLLPSPMSGDSTRNYDHGSVVLPTASSTLPLGTEDDNLASQTSSHANHRENIDDERIAANSDTTSLEDNEDSILEYPDNLICDACRAIMPAFAMAAHQRFHSMSPHNEMA